MRQRAEHHAGLRQIDVVGSLEGDIPTAQTHALPALLVQIGDHHLGAASVNAADGGLPEP